MSTNQITRLNASEELGSDLSDLGEDGDWFQQEDGVLASCTIRSNRKRLPILVPDRTLARESFNVKHCGLIGVYKLMDSRDIVFASNYHGTEAVSVRRKNYDASTSISIAPQLVKYYNLMGVVDLSN
ncbi:hypothetical protein QYM36_012098 [Artemia franciscana]|uniref:Uncharacterized protein n=1 Tax=Artemia franciscana TaxID=6661 RepID=A0AA88L2Z0_ARTSF|nr:hypothetical protein QYM36_012098 [Artemia franciscana]